MSVKVDLEKCDGTGWCVDECTLELLALVDGKVVLTDPQECVDCGRCAAVCPRDALYL